ncbi:hypothetical protein ATCC90586_009203 [Pythium insidiosum]|nr:hypothetical protein ATCC90586_009203 [Pythium insidiosum]
MALAESDTIPALDTQNLLDEPRIIGRPAMVSRALEIEYLLTDIERASYSANRSSASSSASSSNSSSANSANSSANSSSANSIISEDGSSISKNDTSGSDVGDPAAIRRALVRWSPSWVSIHDVEGLRKLDEDGDKKSPTVEFFEYEKIIDARLKDGDV